MFSLSLQDAMPIFVLIVLAYQMELAGKVIVAV